jgi:hypothetical protein
MLAPSLSAALISFSCFLFTSFNITVLYSKNNAAATTEHAAVTTTVTLAVTEYWPAPHQYRLAVIRIASQLTVLRTIDIHERTHQPRHAVQQTRQENPVHHPHT